MKALNLPTKQIDQPFKIIVSRPDSARSSSLATLKIPFPVTIRDLDELPVIYNSDYQTKTRPKVKVAVDVSSCLLRLENQPKSSSESLEGALSPKRKLFMDINTPKCSQNSPLLRRIAKSETLMVKVKPVSIPESVSPLVKEPLLRIPDADLYSDSEIKGRGSFGTMSTCDENEPFTPICIEEGQNNLLARRKTHAVTLSFGAAAESANKLNIPQHGSTPPIAKNTYTVPVSPATDRRKVTTFTQTLKDLGFRTTFNSPKGSPLSSTRRCVKVKGPSICNVEDNSPSKTSKIQGKIQDAFEKAKVYDNLILQQNFEREDEEEEQDFCQLFDILNGKAAKQEMSF